jgi:predicted dehydrogenase
MLPDGTVTRAKGLGMSRLLPLVPALLLPFAVLGRDAPPAPIRVGIIGLDTSHAPAFTKILNDPGNTGDLAGIRVVAAFPGGSPDLPDSRDRVPQYTKQLRAEFGVEIVDSIEALLAKVDAVLLESVDGRPHLEQARPVIAARKPLFIDKPVAGSLADAVRLFALAKEHNVPCFTSSALRFEPGIANLRRSPRVGEVSGCLAYSPCYLESHHPDLFWYGIHGVETLFTVMGSGCESVVRVSAPDTDVVIGTWRDGRVGTFRGLRKGKADFGATAFGTKGIESVSGFSGYAPLVTEIARFFKTGRPPVSAEETLEIYAFMEAADESKRRGGAAVTLASVMEAARRGK